MNAKTGAGDDVDAPGRWELRQSAVVFVLRGWRIYHWRTSITMVSILAGGLGFECFAQRSDFLSEQGELL